MDIILRIQDNNSARQFVKQVPLPCIIGRGKDTNLTIAHPLVSRKHCALLASAGKLVLRDLDSLNGTYIGMKRITQDYPLSLGEIFSVGAINFQCERVVHSKNTNQSPKSPQNLPNATMIPLPTAQVHPNSSTRPAQENNVNLGNEILAAKIPKDEQSGSIILDKSNGSPASLDSSTFAVIPDKKKPDTFSDNEDLALSQDGNSLTIVQDDQNEDELELINDPNIPPFSDMELHLVDSDEPENPFTLPISPEEYQKDPFFGTPKKPFES